MPHPKSATDLFLAPVAVEIDRNLQRLRDLSPAQIAVELELELDRPESPDADRGEREARILQAATRNVTLHDWEAAVSPDGARVRLQGGSVTLDLGLSASIMRYVDGDGA